MKHWKTSSLAVAALLVLSGCASWDNDLDTRKYPGPAISLSDAEAQPLIARIRELRSAGADLRAKLALEPNRSVRMRYYSDLSALGKELGPLERKLAASGRLADVPRS